MRLNHANRDTLWERYAALEKLSAVWVCSLLTQNRCPACGIRKRVAGLFDWQFSQLSETKLEVNVKRIAVSVHR